MKGALAPIESVAFRRLVTARTVSMLGNAVAPVALAFAVLDRTGSATDLGLVVAARSVANVALLLFGGVLADRLPRHLVLVGSSLAAGVTESAVAAVVLTHCGSVLLLAGLSAVNGAVSAFAMPAASALLPQTILPAQRQQANALSRMSSNAALVVGASTGGLLVAAVGPGWGLAADAATFTLAAAEFARVRLPKPDRADVLPRPGPTDLMTASLEPRGMWAELHRGWAEVWSRTWLWSVIVMFMAVNAAVTGGLGVLGPLVADTTFGRRGWGFVLAAQTLGLVAGGLLALRLHLRRLLYVGTALVAFEALPLFALGLTPSLPILMSAAFVAGVALEQFGIAWDTTLQQQVPPDRLARVYSYDMLGSFLAVPAGEITTGPLAALIGTRTTLVVAAVVVVVATAATLISHDLRHLTATPRGRHGSWDPPCRPGTSREQIG